METLRIQLPNERSVTAILSRAQSPDTGWTFIYAPGAGSNIDDPFGDYAASRLAQRGISTARFQFPYMEEKRRAPDRSPVLEATWRAAIEAFHRPDGRLVAAGRSMGGRIASLVAAQGAPLDALALFAYPLHSPGRDEWRDKHFPTISQPALFCSGTRDTFATPGELAEAVSKIKEARVHLLDGADHGFSVRKSSGKTRQDFWDEAIETFIDWLQEIA